MDLISQLPILLNIGVLRIKLTHSFCKLDYFNAMDKIFYTNEMVKLTKIDLIDILQTFCRIGSLWLASRKKFYRMDQSLTYRRYTECLCS